MSKEIKTLLEKLKYRLKQVYGEQFNGAYLFGPYELDYNFDSNIDT